jgi:aspartate ammonia-lyase
VTLAAEAGQLQLNVMEPVIAYNILQSITLLANGVEMLRSKCVAGITANVERCSHHLEASTALATALTPIIGYERAARLTKEVLASGRTIRAVLQEQSDIRADLIESTADLRALTRPNVKRSTSR